MIYIYNYSRFLLYLQGHENFILKHDKKKQATVEFITIIIIIVIRPDELKWFTYID